MQLNSGQKSFLAAAGAIGLLALLLREYYVLAARVDNPMVGDVRQYVSYAYNLVEHHVFSSSVPGSAQVVADSYRGPGYPLFIAAFMLITGASSPDWYFLALHAQAWIGSATVVLATAIGWRHRPATGIAAGLLLAAWPMHITFTGVLLSEVFFGFLLALSTLLGLQAAQGRPALAAASGAGWAWAFLVNPVALFLPAGFAAWLWRRGQRRSAAFLAGAFLLLVAPWAVRNATVDAPHVAPRSVVNFVQGSWPVYHDAWVEFRHDPYARKIIDAIDAEVAAVDRTPAIGLRSMASRMASEPFAYANWYLWQKPFLLWDWDIRVGSGGLYMVNTVDSPFQRKGAWSTMAGALRWANPILFLLALAGVLMAVVRRGRTSPAIAAAALMFAYFTLVHVVFQAEPRYSLAYRFVEFIVAASVVTTWLPRGSRPERTMAATEAPGDA